MGRIIRRRLTFEENTGVARYANVVFTSSGGGAAFERRILLLQWGGAPTIDGSLSIVGGNNNIPASPTRERTGSVRVGVLGGGAEGWAVNVDDPDGFFASVGPRSGDSQGDVITFTYNVNTGIARNARLILVATGRTAGQASEEFPFEQNAAAPAITEVEISNRVSGGIAEVFDPTTENLAATSTGTVSATITLGGGAGGFRVEKTGDDDDAFITSITPERGDRGNNVVSIVYTANPGEARNATLTFTTTGGTGSAVGEQFTLMQAAAAPVNSGSNGREHGEQWYSRFSL